MDSPAFETLKQRFISRCRSDLELVHELTLDASRATDPTVRTVVHRLSGIAGSLGYPDLSDIAKRVDDGFLMAAGPAPEDVRHLEAELVRVCGDL